MLAIAFAGQGAAARLRSRAQALRIVSGVLIAAAAFAMALGLDQDLQLKVPNYVEAVQERLEGFADDELEELTGAREPEVVAENETSTLEDYGPAPEFAGLVGWLNSKPLTLAGLRGRVVLIDFWTYSCINCLRTLPYITEWDERYRASGLTIVGVHTPEFAFERVRANVRDNAEKLGIRYPIALDNDFGTWNAWHNQYWPAKYLIDRAGHVRYYHFGEGDYDESEAAIRELLAERTDADLPAPADLADESPHGLVTPESYLGYQRLDRYVGTAIARDREQRYTFAPVLEDNELTLDGRWQVEGERATAGRDAKLRLRYRASDVFLVLTGRGSVQVLVDGREERRVRVTGDRLYTLVERPQVGEHLLELRFTPGVSGYAFTFG